MKDRDKKRKKKRGDNRSPAPNRRNHLEHAARREVVQGTAPARDHAAASQSRARSLVSVKVLGPVVAVLVLLAAKFAWDENARPDWDASKAAISFLRTEAASRLPPHGDYEAWIFLKNRDGGNAATGVRSNDAELLLISPDRTICIISGTVPDLSRPTEVGPGQTWTMRIAVDASSIRDKNLSAEFRASIEYVAGIDSNNQERTAMTPLCQKLVYDRSADQAQWVSCLGEPAPNCKKVESES